MRRLVAIVGVVLAIAVAGCASPAPSPPSPAGTGHVVVSLEIVPRPQEFFNSQHRARIVDGTGVVLADWEITEAAAPVEVPAGALGLEAFTVFFSDWIRCEPEPAAPGDERCAAPTLGPSTFCQLTFDLVAGTTFEARYRSLVQGGCQLAALPGRS